MYFTFFLVYYYNFAIPDFQPGSVEVIIDIIKVIGFSLKNGIIFKNLIKL